MKRLLVVSDTHGNSARLEKIVSKEYPFTAIVHCGDGVDDLQRIALPDGVEVVRVRGNMDVSVPGDIDEIAFIEIEGVRIMVSHGHRYEVHHGIAWLAREAAAMKVDAVVFGHTHAAHLSGTSPLLFNPGPGMKGCYGVLEIDGTIRCEHRRFE